MVSVHGLWPKEYETLIQIRNRLVAEAKFDSEQSQLYILISADLGSEQNL